jgi:hypothetical protein
MERTEIVFPFLCSICATTLEDHKFGTVTIEKNSFVLVPD